MRYKHGAAANVFKCDSCLAVFRNENLFRIHQCSGIQANENSKTCEICCKEFSRRDALQRHMASQH